MAAGEITQALALLFEPGQVIEVRAITEEGMASGYFDDPEALAAAVVPLDAAGPRCVCGGYGCLEVFAAGPAIAAQAAAVYPAGAPAPDTQQVYALAAAGDPLAEPIVARAAGYLARAVYLLVLSYDVECVVLGGGVSRSGEAFARPLRRALAALRADSPLAMSMLPDEKVVVLPGDVNAGAVGAVYLADHNLNHTGTASRR